jgi:hypothetical protein
MLRYSFKVSCLVTTLAPVSPPRGRAGVNPSHHLPAPLSLPPLRRRRRRPPGVACAMLAAAAGPSPRAWSGGTAHGGPWRRVSAVSGPGAARVFLVAMERPLGGREAVVAGGLPIGRLSAADGALPAQIWALGAHLGLAGPPQARWRRPRRSEERVLGAGWQ